MCHVGWSKDAQSNQSSLKHCKEGEWGLTTQNSIFVGETFKTKMLSPIGELMPYKYKVPSSYYFKLPYPAYYFASTLK